MRCLESRHGRTASPAEQSPSHRLRRRLLGRPHRRRRAGGRCAHRRRRTVVPDLRDAGRAHARARPARAPCRPRPGYEPLLDELLRPVLGRCLENGIRIVSNFGAANPRGAARRIAALAAELGMRAPRIAVVEGDDVGAQGQRPLLREALGPGADVDAVMRTMVCANAYLGADAIADALLAGAEIVVTGRVADPSLAVGPGARPLRLAARRLGPPGARDDGGPPARVRRPGDRRLLRRPRLQGRPRPRPHRLSDRRDRRRRPLHDHQAARNRRAHRRPHGEGAAALRSARSRRVPHARRRRRPARSTRRRARPGSRPARGRSRRRAARDAEGQRLQRERLARRGRDLLRRPARRSARPARGARCSASASARSRRCAST